MCQIVSGQVHQIRDMTWYTQYPLLELESGGYQFEVSFFTHYLKLAI